jgi:uncharacterized repeat protein (TIGR03803 family)
MPSARLNLSALTLVMLSALLLLAARPAQAQTETVLYDFCSQPNCSDGTGPQSGLASDSAGNFYGTTFEGGAYGYGTVFELSPNGIGGWNETVLYSFCPGGYQNCRDGVYPNGALIFDSAGNLYGMAGGGNYGWGEVFELSPTGTSWTETVLFSFANNGVSPVYPINGLIMDSAGNLYGEAEYSTQGAICDAGRRFGGAPGAVFELSPSGGNWSLQQIYTFCPADSRTYRGSASNGGLTMDTAGNIFGVGFDTVFEISPNGSGGWNGTEIHSFPNSVDAEYGRPVLDQAGNLYGTEWTGGTKPGSVYKLSPGATKWQATSLYRFKGGTDGANPVAAVVFDAAGNIYSTTTAGGEYGDGTIFELMAPAKGKSKYQEKVLWSFNGTDGYGGSSLILDNEGNFYGTAGGGYDYNGLVFEVTP